MADDAPGNCLDGVYRGIQLQSVWMRSLEHSELLNIASDIRHIGILEPLFAVRRGLTLAKRFGVAGQPYREEADTPTGRHLFDPSEQGLGTWVSRLKNVREDEAVAWSGACTNHGKN